MHYIMWVIAIDIIEDQVLMGKKLEVNIKKKSKEKEEKRKGGSNKGRKTKLQQVISNNHNNQRGFWKEEILDDKRVLVGKNESVLNNC